MEFQRVKIEILIPAEHVDALREALARAGAGEIGAYDHCTTYWNVHGTWRPQPGAQPFQGTVGQLEHGDEVKVEVIAPVERVKAVLAAIRGVHPYEEPVMHVLPLINEWFDDPTFEGKG